MHKPARFSEPIGGGSTRNKGSDVNRRPLGHAV